MKISNFFPQIKTDDKIQVKKTRRSEDAGETTAGAATGTDRVELSSALMDVQKMKEIIQKTPPVRQEKVQAIKDQVERGEYKIDPRQVANKMLMSLLSDNRLIE